MNKKITKKTVKAKDLKPSKKIINKKQSVGKTDKTITAIVKHAPQPENLPEKVIDKQIIMHYLIVSGIGKNLQEMEKEYFIAMAMEYQLNPFKREIYCIPYEDYRGERNLSVVTGYEVYIKRAEEIGDCIGWRAWTEGELKKNKKTIKRKDKSGKWYEKEAEVWDGNLVAKIKIYRRGWKEPFEHEVLFREYNRENKFWNDMPITMIKKVVTAQGFRLCWQKQMGRMPYIQEEMPDYSEGVIDVTPTDPKDIKKIEDEEKKKQEDEKKIQERDAKLAKLSDYAKNGFKILGYHRAAAAAICEEQGWNNDKIKARIDSIADSIKSETNLFPEAEKK